MRRRVLAIALVILAAVIFCCGCTGTQTTTQGTVQENVIGVLLPLSGDIAESGEASRVALEVAAGDINDYYASIGSDYRVRLHIEDTKADPTVALEMLKKLDAQGIKMVIGPGSSAELDAIRTYADEHGIIIVSILSTAPSLAIPGDNVFRFVPPDTYQADATASLFELDGTAAIVPISRGDIWGDELRNLTATAFEARNGTVYDGVRYMPGSEDYAGMVADLDVQIGQAVAVHGKERVGVYAVTFNEIVPIMTAAAETENLTTVRWYGCDGNGLLNSLATTGDTARFAARTNFTAPAIGNAELDPRSEVVYQKIRDRLGREPDGYSMASYDALWVVTLVGLQTDSPNIAALKAALMETAMWYSCALSEAAEPDPAGDRSTAHYCFLSVEVDGDGYRWVPVAQYDIWDAGRAPDFERINA
ncbi:MAG: ABC transporter substrate-binding protein [Methanoculleus sp.]|nr:ABC transporter substrate-binding protein [Methanoculleus sp.]